jgi:hypothetical protein
MAPLGRSRYRGARREGGSACVTCRAVPPGHLGTSTHDDCYSVHNAHSMFRGLVCVVQVPELAKWTRCMAASGRLSLPLVTGCVYGSGERRKGGKGGLAVKTSLSSHDTQLDVDDAVD